MVFAEERPKLNRLELTQDGELWVGPFIPSEFAMLGRAGLGTPAEPSTWSVLGANGKWLADITLPARFRMLEAGRDYVLGVSRDEDDVESIVMLRLLR
ncbi:MAG: hypothetical protein H7066_20020 [Cytophagaceae bacterium]|nr:hypothetical protein [Gemmatimonadaceae bacterium]